MTHSMRHPIRTTCPLCGRTFGVLAQGDGRVICCPGCGRAYVATVKPRESWLVRWLMWTSSVVLVVIFPALIAVIA